MDTAHALSGRLVSLRRAAHSCPSPVAGHGGSLRHVSQHHCSSTRRYLLPDLGLGQAIPGLVLKLGTILRPYALGKLEGDARPPLVCWRSYQRAMVWCVVRAALLHRVRSCTVDSGFLQGAYFEGQDAGSALAACIQGKGSCERPHVTISKNAQAYPSILTLP